MSIWIRTQNKISLILVDNLWIYQHDSLPRYEIRTDTSLVHNILGRYESEKRVFDILDEIEENVSLGHTFYEMPKD